jgi:hypothetical protein
MIAAVVDLGTYEPLSAISTVKVLKPSINFHEDLSPRNQLLSKEHNELIDVPRLITNMLSYNSPIEVYEDLSFWALHPFPL